MNQDKESEWDREKRSPCKKVLIVVKSLALSGVANVIFTYYSVLSKNEEIHMDFAAGNPIEKKYRSIISNGSSNLYVLPEKNKNLITYIRALASIIRNGKYEVVHVHGNSALIFPELLAAKIGKAKIRIAHSHNTTCKFPFMESLARPLFHVLYTERLACSTEAGKWMFKDRKFTIMKNGIHLDNFEFCNDIREKIRKELNCENSLVLGNVGGFNVRKNHEFLIEVFREFAKENTNAKLLLVGVGENEKVIKKLVNDYKLTEKVIFYGFSENVPALMMAMDVFILTSKFEGLPCVLIEAQALGLPCIVSDRVSKEAQISDAYRVCKLTNDSCKKWCEAITSFTVNRTYLCLKNKEKLKENGYDIRICASKLLEKYGVELHE